MTARQPSTQSSAESAHHALIRHGYALAHESGGHRALVEGCPWCSPTPPGPSGLTLKFYGPEGDEQASVDWQDAAERIVNLIGPVLGDDSARNYARAHNILLAIFGLER